MQVSLVQLVGREPESIEKLLDYGYRAAWKVVAAGETFLVKSDQRAGAIEREVAAHQHAAAYGIPVPELVATMGRPEAGVSFRWVHGVPLHGSRSPVAWGAAGHLLRRIHELPQMEIPEPLDALASFETELAWMVVHGGPAAAEADAALAIESELREVAESGQLAWSHGDCQAAHFIMDPATDDVATVIDWADAHYGRPEMDFAVLTLFDEAVLEWILDGYGASPEFRERLALTLPYLQAVRAAGSHRWLETHGYRGQEWPAATVRAFIHGRRFVREISRQPADSPREG